MQEPKILEAVKKSKEKENIPPTPPIREKETALLTTRARTRERFVKPSIEDVSRHVRDNGYTFDPVAFWNFYESNGWRVGSHVMKSWHAACVTRQKRIDAEKKREAERTAHIDTKMDERERNRERRTGGGRRKADNNVEMSDEVQEEVRRDFAL